MAGLIIWKNQEMSKMRRDIDRLFDRLWDDYDMPLFPTTPRGVPFIDIFETKDNLIIKAEIPGINPEELEISITDDNLTIKGETKHEIIRERENYHRMERRYGSFSRTLKLPCRVLIEDVNATYKKGVLHIVMPKCKPDKARQIKVRVT